MIIGIDGNEANQKVRVGSGIYAFNLLWQIYRQIKNEKLKVKNHNVKFKIYLKENQLNDLPNENDSWKYNIIRPKVLWTQVGLPFQLWKEKILGEAPDVFFTPTHYAPRFCPVPSVITIFDLSFIRFPEMFLKEDLYKLKNWTQYSVKQAKKIITISQFSKKEIIDYYPVSPDKIIVVYPGYNEKKFNSNIKNGKSKIEGDYILYVGTVQPRKNLVRLLEAFAKIKKRDLKLVICGMITEGRGGWMQQEFFQTLKNLKLEKKVIITGFIPDDEMPNLMSGAKTLVLPSLYEGFGIPVVEAMACGVPTVASNVSSLPEIAGDAAILVDPNDITSIADGIKEACYNSSKREKMTKEGFTQAKKFSLERGGKIILNTLTELVSKGPAFQS